MMTVWSLLLLVAPTPAEPSDTPLRTLIIVDASESMGEPRPDGSSHWQAAITELSQFADPAAEHLTVIRAGGNQTCRAELRNEVAHTSWQDRLGVETPVGSTPLARAIRLALREHAREPFEQLLILTDGLESCRGDLDAALEAVQSAGLQMRVRLYGEDDEIQTQWTSYSQMHRGLSLQTTPPPPQPPVSLELDESQAQRELQRGRLEPDDEMSTLDFEMPQLPQEVRRPAPPPPPTAAPAGPSQASSSASTRQRARLYTQSRTPARVVTRVMPQYPPAARQLGWEGDVLLRVSVRPTGAIDAVEVHVSSGYPLLDTVARIAVQQWTYRPATISHRPVHGVVYEAIEFRLVGIRAY